ncbi:MAG TPA: nickel transporter permease [Candidatus Bathyarchaeia archaeon]|nr:nickel transporter permease [Candidatus Bathyarchaeia archaeon]
MTRLSTVIERWKQEHRSQIDDSKYSLYLWKRSPLSMMGLAIVAALIVVAVLAPYIAPYNPIEQDLSMRLSPPSSSHIFGMDTLGRDIFSRVVYGCRITLEIAFVITLIGGSAGSLVGVIAGYSGGKVDEILMRVTDMFLAFPRLILALAFAAALGPSLVNMIIAISVVDWPIYARLARGQALSAKREDFVEAARAMGAGNWRIIFLHILPVCLSPIIVQVTLRLGDVILTAAGLGFLGLGAQPPTPEWGVMVSDGRNFILNEWWIAAFPGFAIMIVVLGFNLLGDGIRDIMDPRLRR